jgi:hypothetical protein
MIEHRENYMRIAALADIHCNNTSHDKLRPLFLQIASERRRTFAVWRSYRLRLA